MRFWEEVWGKGNLETIDQLASPDHMHYGPGNLDGKPRGTEGTKAVVREWRTALPDLQVTVERALAEGDEVVCRLRWSGHQHGPLRGAQPSGREVKMWEIQMCRLVDGKIVEFWSAFDRLSILQQLGIENPTA
ncbi:MAG: ester cyclase [Chloroflexi bacterium]|nr:ester cyclase [Chloroflexota bacterium]